MKEFLTILNGFAALVFTFQFTRAPMEDWPMLAAIVFILLANIYLVHMVDWRRKKRVNKETKESDGEVDTDA